MTAPDLKWPSEEQVERAAKAMAANAVRTMGTPQEATDYANTFWKHWEFVARIALNAARVKP